MRREEAAFVGRTVRELARQGAQPVLNIGSSTAHFRAVEQPHIEAEVFAPLGADGVSVLHLDLKADAGVNITGDVFDTDLQRRVTSLGPRVVLVTNLMEHLRPELRTTLPAILDRLVRPGGFLVITVPYSYPLHFDPIDTYYRPSPEELCAQFPDYRCVTAHVITSTTYFAELAELSPRAKFRIALRALTPFYRPKQWLALAHRFLWLARPYRVSCVVLQKPGA